MQNPLLIRSFQPDDNTLCNGLVFKYSRCQSKNQPTKYGPPENSKRDLSLYIPTFNFFVFIKCL